MDNIKKSTDTSSPNSSSPQTSSPSQGFHIDKSELKKIYNDRELKKAIADEVEAELPTMPSAIILSEVVIGAAIKHCLNPLLIADQVTRHIAFRLLKHVLLALLNTYVADINNIDGLKRKRFERIEPHMVKEIYFGFYESFNFAYSSQDPQFGVLMAQSKDEERDPMGKYVNAELIFEVLKAGLLTPDTITRGLVISAMFDSRTTIHITDPVEESKNKLLLNVTPCNNGVYVPELYEKHGLLTYREARIKYGLYLPFTFAANYLGKDNPCHTLSHETAGKFNPMEWLEQMYAKGSAERVEQFMAVTLAIARPYNIKDYSEGIFLEDRGEGHTGKSTMTTLYASMVGNGHYMEMNLKDLTGAGGFALEVLASLGKCLVIGNENEPKDFVKDLTTYKKMCTGEPLFVNRKGKSILNMVYIGRIIQCINGLIRAQDNSDSAYRRFYPMLLSTHVDVGDGKGGIPDNPYIKEHWMKDQQVIDWVLTEAINRNISTLPKTQEMLELRQEIEETNSSTLRFIKEVLPTMCQNWVNVEDLYPVYVANAKAKGDKPLKLDNFKDEAIRFLKRPDSGWDYARDKNDPNKFAAKHFGSYHIPHSRCDFVNGDLIYATLKNIVREHNEGDPHYVQAGDAITALYRSTPPGTKRGGCFFRTEYGEAATLIDLSRRLISEELNLREGNEPLSNKEVVKMIYDYKEFFNGDDEPDPNLWNGLCVRDADFSQSDLSTHYNSNAYKREKKALWDYTEKRLKKLEKIVNFNEVWR